MQNETFRELYPNLAAEEIDIAQENLDSFLEILWEIAQTAYGGEPPGLTER